MEQNCPEDRRRKLVVSAMAVFNRAKGLDSYLKKLKVCYVDFISNDNLLYVIALERIAD